jgi:hypothetical protein
VAAQPRRCVQYVVVAELARDGAGFRFKEKGRRIDTAELGSRPRDDAGNFSFYENGRRVFVSFKGFCAFYALMRVLQELYMDVVVC